MRNSSSASTKTQIAVPVPLWWTAAIWIGIIAWYFGSVMSTHRRANLVSAFDACLLLATVRSALSARRWARLSMIGIAYAYLVAVIACIFCAIIAGADPEATHTLRVAQMAIQPPGTGYALFLITTATMLWSIAFLSSDAICTWFERGKKNYLQPHQIWISAAITSSIVISCAMISPAPGGLRSATGMTRMSNLVLR